MTKETKERMDQRNGGPTEWMVDCIKEGVVFLKREHGRFLTITRGLHIRHISTPEGSEDGVGQFSPPPGKSNPLAPLTLWVVL